MSRTQIPINVDLVAELATVRPTLAYVAAGLGVSAQTLSHRLADSAELREAFASARSGAAKRKGRPIAALTAPVLASLSPPLTPVTGASAERVLAAVGRGFRTYGQLLGSTGLSHDALVEEVQRQVRLGVLVARESGGMRCHFLIAEASAGGRAV
jgi:hypothetical protein